MTTSLSLVFLEAAWGGFQSANARFEAATRDPRTRLRFATPGRASARGSDTSACIVKRTDRDRTSEVLATSATRQRVAEFAENSDVPCIPPIHKKYIRPLLCLWLVATGLCTARAEEIARFEVPVTGIAVADLPGAGGPSIYVCVRDRKNSGGQRVPFQVARLARGDGQWEVTDRYPGPGDGMVDIDTWRGPDGDRLYLQGAYAFSFRVEPGEEWSYSKLGRVSFWGNVALKPADIDGDGIEEVYVANRHQSPQRYVFIPGDGVEDYIGLREENYRDLSGSEGQRNKRERSGVPRGWFLEHIVPTEVMREEKDIAVEPANRMAPWDWADSTDVDTGDVKGLGREQVFTANLDGHLYCHTQGDGHFDWEAESAGHGEESMLAVAVAAIHPDDSPQVYASNADTRLYRFTYDHEGEWTRSDIGYAGPYPGAIAADESGGRLVTGDRKGTVREFFRRDEKWRSREIGTAEGKISGLVVFDGDKDGEPEVYASTIAGGVYRYALPSQ